MKDVLLRLATDFLSTIVFLVVYLATDNIILATSIGSQAPSRRSLTRVSPGRCSVS